MIQLLIFILSGWSQPMVLPKVESGWINSMDATIDSKGYIHIVWGQPRVGKYGSFTDAFYSYWDGTDWATPEKIPHDGFLSAGPSIVADNSDRLYTFWCEKRDTFVATPPYEAIFYSFRDNEGEWTEPMCFYQDTLFGWWGGILEFGVDSKNCIHTFLYGQMKHFKGCEGSQVQIDTTPYREHGGLDFIIGEGDILHLIYSGIPEGYTLLYGYYSKGKWKDPITVYSTLYSVEPKIVMTDEGRIHIFWLVDWGRDIFYSFSYDEVFWSEPINITNEWEENIDKTSPSVVVDSRDNFHIAWIAQCEPLSTKGRLCYISGDGIHWAKRETLFVDYNTVFPWPEERIQEMVIDIEDMLHLFWICSTDRKEDSIYHTTKAITGIASEEFTFDSYQLLEISPNPFRGVTSIEYRGASREPISLEVYDATGRLVKTLLRAEGIEQRAKSIEWDGRDNENRLLPSGVYFCELTTKSHKITEKLILLR